MSIRGNVVRFDRSGPSKCTRGTVSKSSVGMISLTYRPVIRLRRLGVQIADVVYAFSNTVPPFSSRFMYGVSSPNLELAP